MALTVEHLTRTYAGPAGSPFTAVDDLTFTAGGGEIIGLIGPNGAGKTTTLRTISGILRPASGRVTIDNHDIVADSIAAKRRRIRWTTTSSSLWSRSTFGSWRGCARSRLDRRARSPIENRS
jgi:ABC-type multidrug transport system ATPase subunit